MIDNNQADIMIVDDIPTNLRLLSAILTRAGYQVRPVRDGQTAVNIAFAQPPDLILLDVMMPGIDGYEVCRLLKEDERTRDVPIIFISALNSVKDIVRSFSVGAADYVTKPFQPEEVLARVSAHVTNFKLQHSLREQIAELNAFSHTVAHDLKNPLAAIIGIANLSVAQFQDELPDELQDLLVHIQNASHRTVNIVDELLLLASIRKEDVSIDVTDMTSIVNQACDRLDFMIKEYDAEVIKPTEWPLVMGYGPWLVEVWVNYLSNGLKYGGRPPHLEFGANETENNMIRFWLRDNGAGIGDAELAILFTEFTRLNEVDVKGYGLGLSIVQRIISKLGGKVGAESSLGEGSIFYFELPKALG